MKFISTENIKALNISPALCIDWVKESFLMKYRCNMPPKVPIHFPDSLDFIHTMPCLLPQEFNRFGCKIATRFSASRPSIKSSLTLYDSTDGTLLALIDCQWITAMRTGAVAALSILTLRHSKARTYSFMGLGATGMASLHCFLDATRHEQKTVRLLRHKDQAERAIEQLKCYPGVIFEIADNITELIKNTDVVVSCITQTDSILVKDTSLFKPGILLIPVHTRGFQNCDTIFDKIYGDDTAQISNFQYFKQFRKFNELSRVLLGEDPGREDDSQRIIAYNFGLAIHDVLYACKIEQMINA